jgi:hypothetical protein
MMKPCVECEKQYGEQLCLALGHCAFEDSGELPYKTAQATEHIDLPEGVQIAA